MASFSSTIVTNLSNNGFPTPPTSGYLALIANSGNKATNSGWWAVQVLTNLSTPNGLGQSDLSKISLTAKVRAKGLPSNGAVAILKISATGDNPSQPTLGYKRITFEPVLLSGNDWVTIGGTFDDTGLEAAKGSRYNFVTNATSYEILVELSGFNQSTDPAYVAYNTPTGDSNGGRKNPGLAPNAGIRVEFDDVVLAVANPAAQTTAIASVSPKGGQAGSSVTITGVAFGSAPVVRFNGLTASSVNVNPDGTSITAVVPAGTTTGKITVVGSNATATSPYDFFVTSPANLLADSNFNVSQGQEFWTHFEGAYINTTDLSWSESGSPFLFFPGWLGTPYAGAMQNQIAFNSANGDYFTATFRAKFDPNYRAESTIVAFMDGNAVNELSRTDLTEEISLNHGQWHTYTASFKATPSQLSALNGAMTLKIQPLGRRVLSTEFSSALIDNVVLSQTNSSAIGPQIRVRINGIAQADNGTANLVSPLVGKTTTYNVRVDNTGAENLTISSVTLPGSSFVLGSLPSSPIAVGGTASFTITTTPASLAALSGTLTINNNDKETSDQAFVVNLATTPVNLTDTFNGPETASQLGWVPSASSSSLAGASSTTASGGTMRLVVDSSGDTYPWSYSVSKTFASPGTLDLESSSLLVGLKASGVLTGLTQNKVQVRLESLNSALAVTGSIQLGNWVDETTPNGGYWTPDGINDRVVVLVPEADPSFTEAGGGLDLTGVRTNFDTSAPYYRLVIQMTDFEFDVDANNLVDVDYVQLSLGVAPFTLANGSFEADATDFATGNSPSGWTQFPPEGVSKNLVTNNASVYNQFDTNNTSTTFQAFAGGKAIKVYGQNYYPGGVWQGPSQTGTVYKEFGVASTTFLSVGTVIHARGMAKVFSIDPLTGGSTFNYGFKFMDSSNNEIGRAVTTLSAGNFTADKWVPLTANGTVPAGTDKVQVICEFVQNAATDAGAVYLDDLSVGFGSINATSPAGASTYSLVWSDEFDGTKLNTANWVAETGAGGWGNNEQQTYTTNSANLRIDNGSLILQAVKSGSDWTSARIKSQGLRSFQYGKIEFRAKLPTGIGPWPAAWLLGNNISSVNWPNCGEIDVMEWRGNPTSDANTVGHALHSASANGVNATQLANRSSVVNPSSAFHTYAVVWTSNNLVFSVDGVDKATLTPPPADAAAFRQEFFLILNLAMGGSYVGNTISSSLTSATYEVDYVRVYQGTSSSAPADTTAPVISISGANPASVTWGGTYTDAGATAFDAGDNASVTVTTNNLVNTAVPGSYLVTYTATDSKANTATANRTVNVTMTNGGTNRGADGLTDALRYAFGGTGTSSISRTLLPSNTVSGGNLVLTYYARTNANVTLTPVVSTDLANSNNWTNQGVTVSTLSTVATNGTTLEKRQASTPVSGSKKFLRLKATYTP